MRHMSLIFLAVVVLGGSVVRGDDTVDAVLADYRASLRAAEQSVMEVKEIQEVHNREQPIRIDVMTCTCLRIGDRIQYDASYWHDIDDPQNLNPQDTTVRVEATTIDDQLYLYQRRQDQSIEEENDNEDLEVLYISRNVPDHVLASPQGALLNGYIAGLPDRIDRLLAGGRATARPAREIVQGVPCIVLDLQTDYGMLTAWFSPDRGGALLKARLVGQGESLRPREQNANESNQESPLQDVDRWKQITKDAEIRVEKHGTAWLAVSGECNDEISFMEGPSYRCWTSVVRTLKSADPEAPAPAKVLDVPNGTPVRYIGERSGLTWEWLDGRPVPVENAEDTERLRSQLDSLDLRPSEPEPIRAGLLLIPVALVVLALLGAILISVLPQRKA